MKILEMFDWGYHYGVCDGVEGWKKVQEVVSRKNAANRASARNIGRGNQMKCSQGSGALTRALGKVWCGLTRLTNDR
jgi:hypothetical protein